jgi:hypothetical protein
MKTNTVSKETYQRRLDQLIHDVSNHTYMGELLNIMGEQLVDDELGIYTSSNYTHEDRLHQ